MPYKSTEKQREYQRNWYQKNRAACLARSAFNKKKVKEFLNKIKDNPCTDCGIKYPPCAMDFDHLSDKSFTFAHVTYLNHERLLKEIEKCELVCANCHRIRTHM